MAGADTARLIASLELQDRFTRPLAAAQKQLGGFETRWQRLGRVGRTAMTGLAVGAAAAGTAVAAGLAISVRNGISSLAELEDATTSVDGALKALGLTGQVTAGQVATWANEIETDIGAAFDDKAIVASTATLLRFGKVAPQNLKPAMVVMTDLAAKTGSVDSAATLLAKALADPAKAAGKLSRAGVVLTKSQQDQIKAFMKANRLADAQKVILDSLAQTTKGAAAATQGPYRRALAVLADVTEDAQRALAEGFLPVLQRISTWLSTKLADPRVISDIRGLGQQLAGAFDKAVTFAQNIPWGSIRDAMQLAGTGARAILDAFTQLPPWVQTAVITGWGLNKLTGGAVTSVLGTLFKEGLGVLAKSLGFGATGTMQVAAGIVNVNGPTTPGGGKPGAPGAPAPAGGKPTSPTTVRTPRVSPGRGAEGGFDIAGALKTLAAGLVLAVTLKSDTPQTVKPDATFIRELERMAAAGRGDELISATETVNQALGRLTSKVGDGDRNTAAIARAQNAKLADQKAATDRMVAATQSQRPLLDAIRGGVNATRSTIAGKNFSPTIRNSVTVPVSIRATWTIRDYSRVSAQYQVVAKTPFKGQ